MTTQFDQLSLGSSGVDVTAKLLTFEPGLYSATLTATRFVRGDVGLSLPCVRIDPLLPGTASPGAARVAMVSEGSFLASPADIAIVRVQGGRASVLVSTYRQSGSPDQPELVFAKIDRPLDPAGPAAPPPPPAHEIHPGAVTLLVHVSSIGDVSVGLNTWGGRVGSNLGIEAMSIDGGSIIPPDEIEYQGILGANWNTPWYRSGQLCGSRGIALALLGLRVRLTGASASLYSISYEASLIGGQVIGPVADGEACVEGTRPLEAIRLRLVPRAE